MRHFVREIEHDSWSGPKVLSVQKYDSKEEADGVAHSINSQNTAKVVPDYYITAEVVTDISVSEYEKFIAPIT